MKPPRWRRRPCSQSTLRLPQRRPLFGFPVPSAASTVLESKGPPSNVERSIDKLVGLVRAQRDQTKLPSVHEILVAFNRLLEYRNKFQASLSRSEVYLLTEAFTYIQSHHAEDVGSLLSEADLRQGLSVLASSSRNEKFRSDSKALAFMLFTELRQRTGALGNAIEAETASGQMVTWTYLSILSSTGGAREAWDFLRNSSEGDSQENWIEVIKGLCNERLEEDVWKGLNEMKARTGDLDVEGHEVLTAHLAENATFTATKKMYEQSIAGGDSPNVTCKIRMANLCIRHKELDWGAAILKDLQSVPEDPRVWDVILVSAAAQGATAGNIATMLDNLNEVAIRNDTHGPTMSNINSLIEYAFALGDIQAVQHYRDMAKQRGLRPDAKTFLLQLDYQAKIGDLDQAASTYDMLSSEDPITDESDAPILNTFLRALCFSPCPNYDLVLRVTNSMLERDIYLDAETISGLCKVFLQHDELDEALGLLRQRVDSYPHNDRLRISQIFKEFITDKNVAGQRAFNAYELFRAAFPETPVNDRLPIMHAFFDRKRPDLACLVFGHMRQREDSIARPTPEAYGQCFEGIAKCQDIDGLQMVHNMLKLDLMVEPTTRVRNGLMAAYTACGQPFTAIIDQFWKILTSSEGPTMSSFALGLRACESWVPQGAIEARRIIAMMQAWDLDITKQIYECYVGAIAGQSEFENTVELIEEMENDIGVRPDAVTIGTFYNAIPWQYRKDEVEVWAKQAYPELWEELLTYGEEIDEEWEIRYFKIDRSIDTSDGPLYGEGQYDPQIAQASRMLLEAPPS